MWTKLYFFVCFISEEKIFYPDYMIKIKNFSPKADHLTFFCMYWG